MGSNGRYPSFGELSREEREGRDFARTVVDRGSSIAILALHGGGIEGGTSEIAIALAGTDLSLYCFDGIKPRANNVLHIASRRFDDPLVLELLSRARTAVAIHGCSGEESMVRLGGLDHELMASVGRALAGAGFVAREDDGTYGGLDPENICNRGTSGRGLQLELSRGLRSAMFSGLARGRRGRATETFQRFVAAARGALLSAAATPPASGA